MKKLGYVLLLGVVLPALLAVVNVSATGQEMKDNISDFFHSSSKMQSVADKIKVPIVKNPSWLQAEIEAEEAAAQAARLLAEQQLAAASNSSGNVNYSVETRGVISADLAIFKSYANQTLNDSRGWARLGVSFKEVQSGGSFVLVLSEASQVPSFNYSVCSSYWSCQVGNYVIINQDRWLGATDAWNGAGGSLRDYQHMVINHETGHWLGHGHDNTGCSIAGQLAPIMQQQSMDLRGCVFNPWPLNNEIWSSRLGI